VSLAIESQRSQPWRSGTTWVMLPPRSGRRSELHTPMSKTPRKARHPFDDAIYARKRHQPPPHEFVLDAIASLSPTTRPMFGCLAVYVEDMIVLILRDKPDSAADNGVWLATTADHHESLRREFPRMRSIRVLGKKVTNWQILPADAPDFEEAALRACDLIRARDPRIGKVPKKRVTPKRRMTLKSRGKTTKSTRTASRVGKLRG
jgi:hypothetical protein